MLHYRLKTLMVAVLGVSILCAVFFSVPLFVTASLFVLALMLSVAAVLAGCIYLRDRAQAFCLGCAVPTAFVLVNVLLGEEHWVGDELEDILFEPMFAGGQNDPYAVKLLYLGYLLVVGLSGWTSLSVYALAKRQSQAKSSCVPAEAAKKPYRRPVRKAE